MEPQLNTEGMPRGNLGANWEAKKRAKKRAKGNILKMRGNEAYFGRDGIPMGCTKSCRKA